MRDDLRRVRRPSVPPAAPAAVAEAPAEATRAGDAEARKATPEEVRELIEAAAKVPGGTPEKARSLAKSCTLSVVKAAAAQAAAKGKGWGWVVRTAQAWRVEGVPDHARPDAPGGRSLEEIARSLFGPGGKYSVPTFDMTPYQHLRLRDDR